uniref:Uncharacterized protein n=1 Tax=Moorena producens 3L TaxID=489825 RepID=F4Y0X4_9CYAN|nr:MULTISPECIES: hypothetical protein [Moorena]EGJ29485.1 hypothetical protein LYNGBM3L_62870 [Moorena producens 3L]NEP31824.1 hypothetical protein [Moorena sp. SIO3B2]NEP70189.1 hypothetical protein [Moorena sp. SIO3A5]NEQ08506.1 hypothetical protein [Moorena sp. SIO4E2]NER92152.1 hypothetical protein [Moorena sp. SIO3A2]
MKPCADQNLGAHVFWNPYQPHQPLTLFSKTAHPVADKRLYRKGKRLRLTVEVSLVLFTLTLMVSRVMLVLLTYVFSSPATDH